MESFTIEEIKDMITAIRGQDENLRLNALSNLTVISSVLGPIRTTKELLPYVMETNDFTPNDWIKIASQVGSMLELVGGPSCIDSILQILHYVCEMDNLETRFTAVNSLTKLARQLNSIELTAKYEPFARRLLEDAWFPLRCAGVMLMANIYELFGRDVRESFSDVYKELLIDPNVLVRRTLCKTVPVLVSANSEFFKSFIVALAKDPAAAVATEVPKAMICLKNIANTGDVLKDATQALLSSSSWRVRCVFFSYIDQIYEKAPITPEIFAAGANDTELEVRAIYASQLPFLSMSSVPASTVGAVVSKLVADQYPVVRAALAESIGRLDKEKFRPLIESTLYTLLRDPDQETRLNAVQSVARTGFSIRNAIPSLDEIILHGSFRIRRDLADVIPIIANTMSSDEFVNIGLHIAEKLLYDPAYDVRNRATSALASVARTRDSLWVTINLVPLFVKLYRSLDYHIRETAVNCIIRCGAIAQTRTVIEAAIKDPVPNVRICLARLIPKEETDYIQTLINDPDPDVHLIASKK